MRVKVDDLEYKRHGKIVPHGVYDVGAEGWVSVGVTSDTAEFAVQWIRTWHQTMGHKRYPKAGELTITADCGAPTARAYGCGRSSRRHADETGLTLRVHNYQPGTSKWNWIEHRLFCHITQNWRGRPLTDELGVVELIETTRSQGRKSGAYFFVSP